MPENRESNEGKEIAARIRAILATRNLTLHKVSRDSEVLYATGSDARIPHTLYHSIVQSQEFSPSLAQVCALSRISGYSVQDWLTAFGLDLEAIGGLLGKLPCRRTLLIDPDLDRGDAMVPCLVDRDAVVGRDQATPLATLCTVSMVPVDIFRISASESSLFARIGTEDAFAFPEVLPGSIVRINRKAELPVPTPRQSPMLLIENSRGLWCGRFPRQGRTVHSFSRELPFAPIVFRTPSEARVLGVVDMEIRWCVRFEQPRVPQEFAHEWRPDELKDSAQARELVIRRARIQSGLTLQGASLLTRAIASALRDERFMIAQSTLSDCEAVGAPPRHLRKTIALCLIYGLRLIDVITAIGLGPQQLGQRAIPSELLPPVRFSMKRPAADDTCASNSFRVSRLQVRFGEVPWFLRGALANLTGIRWISLRDFFWLEGDQPFLSLYAQGALAALVDRKRKKPVWDRNLPLWQQPAYVLRLDSGQYLCACCSLDNGVLTLHSPGRSEYEPIHFRYGRDAEVVGQIVALVRRIL